METSRMMDSIAFCGLVCGLCDQNSSCTWCRNPIHPDDKCDKDRCYHRRCCTTKGMKGCWECELFPCTNGRFADENRGQTLGFLSYIKQYGEKALIDKLVSNQKRGIKCGVKGAYRHRPIEEVERLLRYDS